MTPPTYWRMRLVEVKDCVEGHDFRHTKIEADLTDSIQTGGMDRPEPLGSPALPRAGDFFWLIDDNTFQKLIRDAL